MQKNDPVQEMIPPRFTVDDAVMGGEDKPSNGMAYEKLVRRAYGLKKPLGNGVAESDLR